MAEKVKWAYSTVNTLRQCNRKYYFSQVLATHGRKVPVRRKAYELKNMQNLTTQGGHFTSYYLENLATGRSYPKKNLKEFFYEIINDIADQRHEPKERKAIDELHERRRRLKVLEKENIPEYIEQELMSFFAAN